MQTDTSKFGELWSPARQQIWPWKMSKVKAKVTAWCQLKVIKVSFWPAVLVKNQNKMQHREFTCKRDVTPANPQSKICCSFRYKHLHENVCCKYLLFSISLIFMQTKSSFINAFLKIHIFQTPRFYLELDMCLWNTDAPGGNIVKIWQKSPSPTFWPHPTPRGRWCQRSVRNP